MKLFGQKFYQKYKKQTLNYDSSWSWSPALKKSLLNPDAYPQVNKKLDVFLKQNFNKGFVLVLATATIQTRALLHKLKVLKTPYLFLSWDEFIDGGTVTFDVSRAYSAQMNSRESKIDNKKSKQRTYKNKFELKYKKDIFDLKKAVSIYSDYSDLQEVFHYKRSQFQLSEQMFIARWLESLKSLEYILSQKVWLPSTLSFMKFESQNKFGESLLAQQLGFAIPEMVFTNQVDLAREFVAQKETLLKESGLKLYQSKKEVLGIKNSYVKKNDPDLKQIAPAPCMLQEHIQKEYDVRAYLVNGQVFACKIQSQKKDWRGNEAHSPFTKIKMPTDLQSRIQNFAKRMNFQFASFDFVVDGNGVFYFLEMNRPGQWFFAEALSRLPLSKELAKALSQPLAKRSRTK